MSPRRRVFADVQGLVELSRLLMSVAYRSLASADTPVLLSHFRGLVLLARHGPMNAGVWHSTRDLIPSTGTRLCDRFLARNWVDRPPSRTTGEKSSSASTPRWAAARRGRAVTSG